MNALTGTGPLIRLVLRRDRVVLPLWIVLVTAFIAGTASSFAAAYPTPAAQADFVTNVVDNPAIVALVGPVLAPGIGGLVAWRVGTAGSLIVGIIAVLAVIRHTRSEEVAGRQELVRSAAVARYAPLTAILAVVGTGMLLMAVLTTLALAGQGLPVGGSAALAFAFALVGWVFAALAALAEEVCATHRQAIAFCVGGLALAILLRMGADGSGADGPLAWLAWATPVGWMQQVEAFGSDRWWVFLLFLATTAGLTASAYLVRQHRDIGAGMLAERPGPAHAASTLAGPLGLAWRQNRGLVISVLVGYALLGLLLGGAADGASHAGAQLGPFLARLGAATPGEAFVILLTYVFAEVLSVYAISGVLRARTDETGGLASVLLATPVSRTRWIVSQLVIVVLGSAAAMVVLGVAVGVSYGLANGDLGGQVVASLGFATSKVPAVWALAGVTTLLFGLVPRAATAVSWAVLGIVLVLEIGWELGAVPDALFAVSPFSWVYPLNGQTTAGAIIGVTLAAAVLMGGGVLALRRRDIG